MKYLAPLALAVGTLAMAQPVPQTINYQGRLTDNSPQQNPLTGTYGMTFEIWTDQVAGTMEWSEGPVSVAVVNGIFNVILGSHGSPVPRTVFAGTRYLSITVDGETLAPRQELTSTGYAHVAETSADADALGGIGSTGWQQRVSASCPSGSSIAIIYPNGAVACEVDDTGITSETDPKVGTLSTNYLPRWNGSTLTNSLLSDDGTTVQAGGPVQVTGPLSVTGSSTVNGTAYVNGNLGINKSSPTASLDIVGSSMRVYHPTGTNGAGFKLNIGDGDYVYLHEDVDDRLTIKANRLSVTGSLGIGVLEPSQMLHVAGNAQVDGTITMATQTRYLTLGPGDFSFTTPPESSGYLQHWVRVHADSLEVDVMPGVPFTYFSASAALHLPHGATITRLEVRLTDTSSVNNAGVVLTRLGFSDQLETNLSSLSTSGTPGATTLDSGPLSHGVDARQVYSVQLYWSAEDISPPPIKFHAARITYTVTEPLP